MEVNERNSSNKIYYEEQILERCLDQISLSGTPKLSSLMLSLMLEKGWHASLPLKVFRTESCGDIPIREEGYNTLGVCHQLSSGFELKHDRSSGVEDVKVKCMKLSSARIWIKHLVYMITLFKIYVWVMLMKLVSCVSHHSLSIVITGKVSWHLESKSHMKW